MTQDQSYELRKRGTPQAEIPRHEAERMLRLCRASKISWPGPEDQRDQYAGFRLFVSAPVMARLTEEFPEAAHMFRVYPDKDQSFPPAERSRFNSPGTVRTADGRTVAS